MAVISKGTSESPRVGVVAKPAVTLALPEEKSVPREDLGDYTVLLYGEKKIGKTSLAAQFPEALFMMFEPGGKGLSIYQQPITNWSEFKEYVRLLKGTDRFKLVVIDTVDIAYDRCLTWVGKREGFVHPNDANDFGKSWQLVMKEFQSVIYDLIGTGRGVLFTSHSKETEFTEASGAKYNKVVPTMSGQVQKFVTGFVDIIGYYGYYGNERYLTIRGSDAVEAGHRVDGRFMTPDGDRVSAVPMGDSPQEGYSNILKAFNNEQEDTFEVERESAMNLITSKKLKAKR